MPLDNTTGYLEQGYANVAAAPLDMQLDQIQMRKTALSQAQSNLRTSNYKENKRNEDDQTMDDYASFTEQLSNDGVVGEDLYSQLGEYIARNPNAGSHPGIMDSIASSSALDRLTDRARQTVTNKKRDRIENALLDNQEANLPRRMEANNLAIDAQLASSASTLEKVNALKSANIQQNALNLSADLYTGLSNAPIEVRQDAIGLFNSMAKSENPDDQEFSRSMMETVYNLGTASSLEKIGQFKMERHAPFLLSFKGKYEVDVRGIEDPETREETLKQMANAMQAKGADDQEFEKFNEFVDATAQSSRLKDDASNMTEDFYEIVTELNGLDGELDPAKKKEMRQKMSYLMTRSTVNRGYVESGRKEIAASEALLKTQKEEDDRLYQIERDKLSDNVEVAKLALAQEKHLWSVRASKANDQGSAFRLGLKMKDKGQNSLLGLDSDATAEEYAAAILKFEYSGLSDSVSGEPNF